MKIFDTINNPKWSGRNFTSEQNLRLNRSSIVKHKINLVKGFISIKIIARSIRLATLTIKVESKDHTFSRDITINNETEEDLQFYSESKEAELILEYRQTSGFIDIDRLSISSKDAIIKKPTSDIRSAVIIPYKIYGGAEVYIANIINRSNADITMIYLSQNYISNVVSRKEKTLNIEQLQGYVRTEDFDSIVYYNRADVHLKLQEIKHQIKSRLIEVYHSDFKWPGALSHINTRDNTLIKVSESVGNHISSLNTHIVPVGIDLRIYQDLSEKPDKTIGTVARLSKEKNIDYILDVAEILSDFKFIIVGDGPEADRLKKRATSNVEFLGFVSNTSNIYQKFKGFLLASNMEGTPISILEALASGNTVYSNYVGGIKDILNENNSYQVFNDPEKDAEIIRNTINTKFKVDMSKYDINTTSRAFDQIAFSGPGYNKITTNLLKGSYI